MQQTEYAKARFSVVRGGKYSRMDEKLPGFGWGWVEWVRMRGGGGNCHATSVFYCCFGVVCVALETRPGSSRIASEESR